MASRGCKHPADAFCYVCGYFIKTRAKKYSLETCFKMCEAYNAYFGMPVGDQDKSWAPHFACENCKRTLEVDGCIHRAAGPLLKLECSSLGGCETGQAKITCGYLLPAKYVIHTVGPVAQGHPSPSQQEELMNCYKNSMYLASESKLHTVAFPCISTGVFGYPAEEAAEVALGTIRSYLEEKKDKFDRIIICVFLEKDEEIYLKKLPEYFPFDWAEMSCKL